MILRCTGWHFTMKFSSWFPKWLYWWRDARYNIDAMTEYIESLNEVIQTHNNEVIRREEEKVVALLEMKNIYEKYGKDSDKLLSAMREYKFAGYIVNSDRIQTEKYKHLRRLSVFWLRAYQDKVCLNKLTNKKQEILPEQIQEEVARLSTDAESRIEKEIEHIELAKHLEEEKENIPESSFEDLSDEDYNRYIEEIKKFKQ